MATGVYLITCLVTGEVYVGSSRDIPRRWKDHLRELRKGSHSNSRLQKAWLRYGEQSFNLSVLESVPADQMLARETAWISQFNACTKGVGYNLLITAYSRLGMPHTEVTKLKMSLAKRGRSNGHLGLLRSDETKRRMSIAQKGRVVTEEHRRKIAETLRGTTLSAETRKKLSVANKGKPKPSDFAVRVSEAQALFDRGQIVDIRQRHKDGESMRSLARHYATSHAVIGKVIHRKGAFYASVIEGGD